MSKLLWPSIAFVIIIVLLTLLIGWSAEASLRGTFGDMFGAANAIFSGMAFIGVIYAILLQREELMLQREELKNTREELKRSASAQEKVEQHMDRNNHLNVISAKIQTLLNIKTQTDLKIEYLERRISELFSGDNKYFRLNEQILKKYRDDIEVLQNTSSDLNNQIKILYDELINMG